LSWHRLIKIPKRKNVFFHYTVEAYENLGLLTTLKKEGAYLILECSAPLKGSVYFDKIITALLKEIGKDNDE
jgi:hypothetical protein